MDANKSDDDIGGRVTPQRDLFRWVAHVGVPLLCLTLGATGNALWHRWNNRLRTLEYYTVSASAIIAKPELGGKVVEIRIDDEPVSNVSTVRVDLYNRTDVDYADLPLVVSFSSTDGTTPELLQAFFTERPDAPVEEHLSQVVTGAMRFHYTLRVVNRGEQPVFQAQYAFPGDTAPTVSIAIPTPGVDVAPIPLGAAGPSGELIFSVLGVMVGVVIAAGYAGVLSGRLAFNRRQRNMAIEDATEVARVAYHARLKQLEDARKVTH